MSDEVFHMSLTLSARRDRHKLRTIVEQIEALTQVPDIADNIEIVIAELINNSVKTCLRHMYFEAKGFFLDNEESFKVGLKSFKANFSYLNLFYYEKAMELLKLLLDVEVDKAKGYVIITVQSKHKLAELEEKLIRSHLKRAMDALDDEMLNLYVQYGDEDEQHGLGLTMAVDIVRKMGFDPSHFRIFNEGDYAKARLELALSDDYAYSRDYHNR